MSKSSITTKGIATPNRVTAHPGEVLNEEFLRPLGLTVNALAMALRSRPRASAQSSRASGR
jgi:plasmid maintenance system antidote protein VapI